MTDKPDSSAGVVISLQDGRPRNRGLTPGKGKIFLTPRSPLTGSGAHAAIYSIGIGGKAGPGSEPNYLSSSGT
jgi:hypothetical protein